MKMKTDEIVLYAVIMESIVAMIVAIWYVNAFLGIFLSFSCGYLWSYAFYKLWKARKQEKRELKEISKLKGYIEMVNGSRIAIGNDETDRSFQIRMARRRTEREELDPAFPVSQMTMPPVTVSQLRNTPYGRSYSFPLLFDYVDTVARFDRTGRNPATTPPPPPPPPRPPSNPAKDSVKCPEKELVAAKVKSAIDQLEIND